MTDPPALRHPAVTELLSWPRRVERWLAVEAALARACGRLGIVGDDAAEAVASRCTLDHIDLVALESDAADAATPIIPLVRQLEGIVPPDARGAVHHGATSQDILDTAAMLEARDAVAIVLDELLSAGARCAELAEAERDTVVVGRTLLQHAVPITFGLRAARWLGALTGHVTRLRTLRFPAQLGSAAGTLAPYGDRGLEVMTEVAAQLDLTEPTLPWHAERDPVGELVTALALVAATCATIAHDLVLLSQTEVGEIRDRRAGGSSTMPQKHNPVDATFARAAARLATGAAATVLGAGPHEHERAAGAWQVEWAAVPQVLGATAAAARRLRLALEAVEIDHDAVSRNLERSGGQILAEALSLALVPALGREPARELVSELATRAAEQRRHLLDVAAEDPTVTHELDDATLRAMRDPGRYVGVSSQLVDRALDAWRDLGG